MRPRDNFRRRVQIEDDEAPSNASSPRNSDGGDEDAAGAGGEEDSAPSPVRRVRPSDGKRGALCEQTITHSLVDFLGEHGEAGDLLPTKCGWLEKATPRWMFPWQPRWFVLCRKQLQWYVGPQDRVPLGVLDFDLVACEVECLWTAARAPDGAIVAPAPQGKASRMYCAGCDPMMMFADRLDAVVFRISPRGSDRAFELRAESQAEGEAWVEALALHIETADPPAHTPSDLDALSRNLGRRWWKVKRISPQKFEALAKTGDILLFRSLGSMPKLIRSISGGHFDHVALVLQVADGRICLLESTGGQGVSVCTWEEFLANDWYSLYPELTLRRVRFLRTHNRLIALQKWIEEVIGKPYGLTINKLMQRKSVSMGGAATDEAFFCSQLVAEGLKILDVIPRGLSSTQYWPATFEAAHRPVIETSEHATFGEELTIDFSLLPRAEASGGKKERDVTCAWTG